MTHLISDGRRAKVHRRFLLETWLEGGGIYLASYCEPFSHEKDSAADRSLHRSGGFICGLIRIRSLAERYLPGIYGDGTKSIRIYLELLNPSTSD